MKIRVKVTPGSENNEIIGWFGEQLKIRISTIPEKGLANKELIKFLAEELKISKSSISIIQGLNSPSKLIEIEDLTASEFNEILDIHEIQKELI